MSIIKAKYSSEYNSEIIITDSINSFINSFNNNLKFFLIADGYIANNHLQEIDNAFSKIGYTHHLILGTGEESKNFKIIEGIYKYLLDNNINKNDYIIGIGGGTILDITGFIASTILRGVNLAYIPTTLLSQIDSSIGGKTAVNFNNYKNMIGSIFPASKIFINPNFIFSQNEEDYLCGISEIIKIALIKDKELCEFLFRSKEKILKRDYSTLQFLIEKSIALKNEIVENDLYDKNSRNFLNLGHTIGHAIESFSNFKIKHGLAVSMGIYQEAILGNKLNIVSSDTLDYIHNLLKTFNLPCNIELTDNLSFENILKYISSDKKVIDANYIRMPFITSPGNATLKDIELVNLMHGTL